MKTEIDTGIENKDQKTRAVIILEDICKSFGKQKVLDGISLELKSGENLVILGKSGSGKSVMIKCIAALLKQDSGKITVLEKNTAELDAEGLSELRKNIGFVFQNGALYDSMSVRQNLEFPLRRVKREMNEKEILEKIELTLENVGLSNTLDKMPSELSGGMRKRISLARTLVLDPKIMLYDEPTAGLDPVTSDEISALIMELREKYQTSSIVITHDIPCARAIADRLIMLKDNRIYAEGEIASFTDSKDPDIAAFFK